MLAVKTCIALPFSQWQVKNKVNIFLPEWKNQRTEEDISSGILPTYSLTCIVLLGLFHHGCPTRFPVPKVGKCRSLTSEWTRVWEAPLVGDCLSEWQMSFCSHLWQVDYSAALCYPENSPMHPSTYFLGYCYWPVATINSMSLAAKANR